MIRVEMHPTSQVGKCDGRHCTASQVYVISAGDKSMNLCDRCVIDLRAALAVAGVGDARETLKVMKGSATTQFLNQAA